MNQPSVTINTTLLSCDPSMEWVDYTATQEDNEPLRGFLRVKRNTDEAERIKAILQHIEERGGMDNFPSVWDVESEINDPLINLWVSPRETAHLNIGEDGYPVSYTEIEADINRFELGEHIILTYEDDKLEIQPDAPSLFNWWEYYNGDEPAGGNIPKQSAAVLEVQIVFDRDTLYELGITPQQAANSLRLVEDEYADGIRIRSELPGLVPQGEFLVCGSQSQITYCAQLD